MRSVPSQSYLTVVFGHRGHPSSLHVPPPPTPPAVPHTCRQKTVAATALFEVTHAMHARNAVSRRSSANRSTKGWRAHIRTAMNGQSGSCVSALLFLTRFPTAPPLANISAAVKSTLGLPRHANIGKLSTVVHVSVSLGVLSLDDVCPTVAHVSRQDCHRSNAIQTNNTSCLSVSFLCNNAYRAQSSSKLIIAKISR